MRAIFAIIAAALAAAPVGAYEKLSSGIHFNTPYEVIQPGWRTWTVHDDELTVTADQIETIACADCERPRRYPGNLFHATNRSTHPICVKLTLRMRDRARAWGRYIWGSGESVLVPAGATVRRFAGITLPNGTEGYVDLTFTPRITDWEPQDGKTCGAAPS